MKTYNNPMKVLAADDDDMNLFILAKNLRAAGYTPIEAVDGTEAWQEITKNPSAVDIAMLDRMMPGFDGLQLSTKIRNQPETRFMPIIIQSGKVGPDVLELAYNAGADRYLIKPFSEGHMKNMVDKARADVEKHHLLLNLLENPSSMNSSPVIKFRAIEEGYPVAASLAQGAKDRIGVAEALSEILTNAVEHGNLRIGLENKKKLVASCTWHKEVETRMADPVLGSRYVTVQVEESGGRRIVTITDEGKGFKWQKYAEYSTDNIIELCGRGINKAIKILGNVEFLETGNAVRCAFAVE